MKIIQTKWPTYILSGGKSSRFGSDKARFMIEKKPLIQHVYDSLKPMSTSICVIADKPDKYQDLGLNTMTDIHGGLGPISGIHTALKHAQEPWIFIASCDLLGFDSQWVSLLWSALHPKSQILAFKSQKWEPLFAFYHQSSLVIIEDMIDNQNFTLWKLLERLNTTAVLHPRQWEQVTQVNRKDDLI